MAIQFLARTLTHEIKRSSIEPFRFPAGEWLLRGINPKEKTAGAVLYGADSDDLIILGLWANAMKFMGQPTVAYIPYFPAARADRGTPFGAQVYARIVNSFELDEVVIFDPHSPVIVNEINNVRVVNSDQVIKDTLSLSSNDYVGVIAPDEGARKRTEQVARALNLPVFQGYKTRDFETGKLSGFRIDSLPVAGKLLIVDDICDGGGTFAGLVAAAKLPPERVDLWVSHGVFSGKAPENLKAFETVYTTDSYPNAEKKLSNSSITRILPYLMK